jgi:hypothetical protein
VPQPLTPQPARATVTIVTIWRALVGIGRRLQHDPLRMMDLGRCLSGTGEGASLLTGPFDLYNRTNTRPINVAAGRDEIGSYYNTVAYFMTVPAGRPCRHGTPMVRLTKGRPRTPCCRATRPKNLGYGEIKGRGLGSRTQGRSGGEMFMFIRSYMLLAAGMLALAPAHAQ